MASMSINGVVSGMDWESMIDEIITNAARPAQVQVNKKTDLTNKKSLFEEMKVMVNSISSSMSALKMPSTYKAKEIEIENLGSTGSYKSVLTATVNADAEVNVYDLVVNRIATAQTNRSNQIKDSTLSNTLGSLTDNKIFISAAGQKVGIEVKADDTLHTLRSRINTALKTLDTPLNITSYVTDNRLMIKSDYTGLGNDTVEETITYNPNGYNRLSNILVDDSNKANLTIKGYTQGSDYAVVTGDYGTEIRWNKNNDTNEVKLGKTVKLGYTMGVGDKYDSSTVNKSATKGSDEESSTSVKSILGFEPKYNEQLKIRDADGNIYKYGVDFTLNSSGAVEWIEPVNESKEPSGTYTVSLNKTAVSYNPSSITTASANVRDSSNSNVSFAAFTSSYETLSGSTMGTVTGYDTTSTSTAFPSGYEYHYLDAASGSNYTITDANGQTYEYGKDFVIRTSNGGNVVGSNTAIAWAGNGNTSTVNSTFAPYLTATGTTLSEYTTIPGVSYTLSYGKTYTATGDSSTDISTLLGTSVSSSDYENLVITDTDGNTYAYGTDFTIDSEGKIEWLGTQSNVGASKPADGTEYYFEYTSAEAITGTVTSINSTRDFLYFNADDQTGANGLTWSQFINDIGGTLTADAVNEYLTIQSIDSDGNVTNYTYGKDFTLASSGAGPYIGITWGGSNGTAKPASYTAIFTGHTTGVKSGGEVLEFDVERGNTDSINSTPEYSLFEDGTTIINYGGKSFYEGVDFDVTQDDDGNAQISWITGTDYEWYYPTPGSNYTINLTDSNGDNYSYTARRNSSDSVNIMDGSGLTTANGTITNLACNYINYDLTDPTAKYNAEQARKVAGASVGSIDSSGNVDISWSQPETTSRTLPDYFTDLTVSYSYDANTFELSDDADGALLQALGFTDSNGDYQNFTAAQDAELVLDGETITRSENYLSDDYGNALIKGTAITLKGPGHVSLDISQDAQKAVESIQTFVDNYNSLMSWMNTRMTEKQLDEDTKATVDSDDFKMRWGLLHGNALLRQTKSQMRTITSQNFTFSFTQRNSSEEVYGTMAHNGLKSVSTLRLRVGTKYVDVSIEPTDTLKDIVAKINDDTKGGPMNDIYYDDQGNKLTTPLIKAEVANDLLIINSPDGQEITMSGTAAMNALKMNYSYRGLYQLGIATTSTDYGKSGELEFDTSKFMEALEDNPDEVQTLMLKFAGEMDSWLKSMTTTSASGQTSGTLTRQIEDLDTRINSINEYLQKYQDRLDRMEERLRTQYASAEDNFAKLSQQANSIASILTMMTNSGSNSSSSTSS